MVVYSEIKEANGKTIRENNLARVHKYKLGELVSVEVDIWNSDENGAEVNLKGHCILYVVLQSRDCDGSPLYTLSDFPCKIKGMGAFTENHRWFSTFAKVVDRNRSEESLTPTGRSVTLFEDMETYIRSLGLHTKD